VDSNGGASLIVKLNKTGVYSGLGKTDAAQDPLGTSDPLDYKNVYPL